MKRSQWVAGGVALAVAFGGGVASAVTKVPSSVRACVDKAGTLSLMSKGKCAKGSTGLRLGVAGKTGSTGPAGPAGSPGASGTNGLNGANGTNGAVGPSDVYGWQGSLNAGSPSSPSMTVPGGSYVVKWQGALTNATSTPYTVFCSLDLNGDGSAFGITVPPGAALQTGQEILVHAVAPFSAQLDCNSPAGFDTVGIVVTATATGSLHGTTVKQLP